MPLAPHPARKASLPILPKPLIPIRTVILRLSLSYQGVSCDRSG
jgi:hypothetical protein